MAVIDWLGWPRPQRWAISLGIGLLLGLLGPFGRGMTCPIECRNSAAAVERGFAKGGIYSRQDGLLPFAKRQRRAGRR